MNRLYSCIAIVLLSPACPAWAEDTIPPSVTNQYQQLVTAWHSYAQMVTLGWVAVAQGPKLVVGDRGERVVALRHRLETEGYLTPILPEQADFFDQGLETAVKEFQQRHGLEIDGQVGTGTLTTLNIPAEERICQLKVNLHRLLAYPPTLPDQYIRVNIPAFQLDVMEAERSVMKMKVVVGRRSRKTPIFNDAIEYLVLNPAWYVPRKIAIHDKLPKMQKDPNYLAKQHMKLFSGVGEDAVEVDAATIDWSTTTAENFPYRIIQKSGDGNALGDIKFIFPNSYEVYLHDTSERHLFQKSARAYSSGCIRVEKPVELAEYLLRMDSQWDRAKILSTIQEGKEHTVRLAQPFPVRIEYITTWVDEDGTLHFREDLYKRDAKERKVVCQSEVIVPINQFPNDSQSPAGRR